jgi:hypothetical protein
MVGFRIVVCDVCPIVKVAVATDDAVLTLPVAVAAQSNSRTAKVVFETHVLPATTDADPTTAAAAEVMSLQLAPSPIHSTHRQRRCGHDR